MRFTETAVTGAWTIELEQLEDERGFFARQWDSDEFGRRGLSSRIVHCSVSYNRAQGTLRGMHYQASPFEESKLVRCTAGAIFDVAVDLRPESATFTRWCGVELTADNRRALYVPDGCAHGFLTLAPDSEVLYLISEHHQPEVARGVRWNDPAFGIEWPGEVVVINERDRAYPDFGDGVRES